MKKPMYAIKGYGAGRAFPAFYDNLPNLKIARQWLSNMKDDGFWSYELYKDVPCNNAIGITRELIEERAF